MREIGGDRISGIIENLWRSYERRSVKNALIFLAVAPILAGLALIGYYTGFLDSASFYVVFFYFGIGWLWIAFGYWIFRKRMRRVRKELQEEPRIREKISFEEPPYTTSRWER